MTLGMKIGQENFRVMKQKRATRLSAQALIVCLSLAVFTGCSPDVVEKPVDLVWPDPPENSRVKYIRSLSHEGDFGSPGIEWLDQLIQKKTTRRTMGRPYAVATDREGKVYVTDNERAVVWVFDDMSRKVGILGGLASGRLNQPVGLVVNKRGTIFISDVYSKRVYAFSPIGNLVMALGQRNELGNPVGLAMDEATGWLYVADSQKHKVRVYSSDDGKFLFEFGQRGNGDGEFNAPTYLSIGNGKLYVSDSANYRIQIFDLRGKFLKKFGSMGDQPGKFARPRGVAVDSAGHVYVTDAVLNNLQIFDDEGRFHLSVGAGRRGPGLFSLPAGVHVDGKDKIYVADSYNGRVQVFQYLGKKITAVSLN